MRCWPLCLAPVRFIFLLATAALRLSLDRLTPYAMTSTPSDRSNPMKAETNPQPRAAEAQADEASAQAAVQVALDRRDNGGHAGGAPGQYRAGGASGQHRTGTEHDR